MDTRAEGDGKGDLRAFSSSRFCWYRARERRFVIGSGVTEARLAERRRDSGLVLGEAKEVRSVETRTGSLNLRGLVVVSVGDEEEEDQE